MINIVRIGSWARIQAIGQKMFDSVNAFRQEMTDMLCVLSSSSNINPNETILNGKSYTDTLGCIQFMMFQDVTPCNFVHT
jgi:hypothetical protein